uniref:Uncharacterized protein n=1 Tax=Setaria italica TaxID=4555 RepID=K3ZGU0_SETIT
MNQIIMYHIFPVNKFEEWKNSTQDLALAGQH